ncbi:MAG: pyruvate decarboxylase [Caulobacter sp.]|jgi:indolepyruvate decarboxylase|nr:pyruvate decarboxylase [Caulobacter sp.]
MAPSPAPYTVAQYLVDRLIQCGLKHMFAVPGDYCGPFLEALDATAGIERVPNINELGSGYAADGYARFTGIGAACVQYGVGTFSALCPAAGSYVERLPVAIISSSPSTKARIQELTQGVLYHHSTGDLEADRQVYENVTVASEIVLDADSAPAQIDHALTEMLTWHRPCYIEVIQNVWKLPCARPEGAIVPAVATSDAATLAAALDAAWERIQGARQPVLWFGVEVQRYGLQDLAQQIVEASGLPFTTTSLGKTVLDEAQPLFIGTYAGPASPAVTRAVVDNSDAVLALGTIITDDYLKIMASSYGQMVEVNDEECRVGYAQFTQVTLADFLQELLERFKTSPGYPTTFTPPTVPPDDNEDTADGKPVPAGQLTYNRFYNQLSGWLKDQGLFDSAVLVLGESTSLYVFGNLFGLPRDSFVSQAAWGSLGHETGCALGVAIGSGKRPFVVAGDGGFMMICQEISSLVRAKVPAVVFVMSNQGYAIEQAFVDLDAFTPEGEFAPFDVLPSWDYLALAKAFGARGFRASTEDEMADVLAAVKGLTDVPALVEVVIPPKDLAPQLYRLAYVPPTLSKYHQTE